MYKNYLYVNNVFWAMRFYYIQRMKSTIRISIISSKHICTFLLKNPKTLLGFSHATFITSNKTLSNKCNVL